MKCGDNCEAMPRYPHWVLVQKPNDSASTNAAGHIDLTDNANWLPVAKLKCRIITRGGAERWRFNQVAAEVSRIVEIRSNKTARTIQSRWRLKFIEDGRVRIFDIEAAFDVDGNKQLVEVHCTEAV